MAEKQMWLQFDELQTNPEPANTLPYFPEPTCDNERLLNFQHDYRVNGNARALNAMYELGFKIALKYINAKANGNAHVAQLSGDEKAEKAHNAITYVIARFLKKKNFVIKESFTAYIYLRVLHELFYRRKVDGLVYFCADPKSEKGAQIGEGKENNND